MPLTVVFDLDGTLVDTAPDLIESLNVVFAGEQLPPLVYAEARNLIGGGARAMIEGGLKRQGHPATRGDVDRMFRAFVDYYGAHVADRSQAFPGLDGALDALAAQGCRFAVCTNKLEGLSRQLLEALRVTHRFDAICGQDTFRIQKPDPEILIRTIEAANGDPRHAVMVGDSGTDIATARAAGVPIVAVDFGYNEIPVAELRPDALISHFDQLPAAVMDLAAKVS